MCRFNIAQSCSIKDSELIVGRYSINELIKKVQSPLYLYDAKLFRDCYQRLRAAIPNSCQIYYSVKANPHPVIINFFGKLGAKCEVASQGEFEAAVRANLKADEIIFTGPGKKYQELEFAIKEGIGIINVESKNELQKIIKIATLLKKIVKITIRLNLTIPTDGQVNLMGGSATKFGVDEGDVTELFKIAIGNDQIDFLGFHSFVGTQILASDFFSDAYRYFVEWVKDFSLYHDVKIKSLNFGGGFGVPFTETDSELNIESVGATLSELHQELSKLDNFKEVEFIVEPGRYLTAQGGVYVSKVIDIKISHGKKFVITDGGLHHALSPIVMNQNYPTLLLNKLDQDPTEYVTVCGPLCSSADMFSKEVKLPSVAIDDIVGIFNSGAYGYSASMNLFLSHPSPAEVLLDNENLFMLRMPQIEKLPLRFDLIT